jgi:hypothetical protein
MNQNSDKHSVRRIVLPSGRSIEVVRFSPGTSPAGGLHVCPNCSSHLVQPLDWSESEKSGWELTLHCPNCDWLTEGVFSQERVDEFEEQLDQGLAEMLNDLRRLTQANMSEEIDRFAAALNADLILPEDF